jgi:hypothetical protein
MKNRNIIFATIFLALGLLAFSPVAQAVNPPPDGGYPGFNTAEGQNALMNLTTGAANTAVGWFSLWSDTDGSYNTAVGAGTLLFNVGNQSTGEGAQNTAIGTAALLNNTTGSQNTANGALALFSNTEASYNTATGNQALFSDTTGTVNTANGAGALFNNTTGHHNTAIGGDFVLFNNTTGSLNTAIGAMTLSSNVNTDQNTAVGAGALQNATSNNNIALGTFAGANLTTGAFNIDIGHVGVTGDGFTIRIGEGQTRTFIDGIRTATILADAAPVFIDSLGQLGTMSSSCRFKKEIKPMERASEGILALKPVTFQYKSDATNTPQFGLVAEEVAEVNPNLVIRDKNGEIYTVRYEAVNAMLLNEFLKEHKKVQEQQATIAALKSTVAQQQKGFESKLTKQEKQIEALTAGLQKVSAQLESNKLAPQTVKNDVADIRKEAQQLRGARN